MNLHASKLKLLLAPLIVAGLAWPASSETIIRKYVTYFSIFGKTAEDLDRELSKRGPVAGTSGMRHPGATRISFTGTATFIGKGGKCYIGGAKVALSTKLILPRWANRKHATPRIAVIWDALSSDIKRHEERHAEIARNHARALEKAILSLPKTGDCPSLKAKVNRISNQAIKDHDADQRRFDRVEAANFDRRMIRLLKNRISASAAD